ncbi:MAG: hypothetical protein IJ408_04550 [Clostridia bacterium]|nr:hypothetical protein [Clostridia bacterium]
MENYNRTCPCSYNTVSTCYNVVLSIVGALLAFAIGLIVGLAAFETFTTYFTAIVAIAIALAVMFIVFLVLRFCQPRRSNC